MIKPEDLRIGNILWHKIAECPIIVDSIDSIGFTFDDRIENPIVYDEDFSIFVAFDDEKKYSPIQLNEEWAIKCGVKYVHELQNLYLP